MIDSKVVDDINRLLVPILKEEELCLIDTSFFFQSGRWILRLLVDKINGGISLDECTKLNQKIGDLIEQQDMIKHSYVLEISSPGVDRPLRTPEDFSRSLNRKVRIILSQSIEGKYEIQGVVTEVTESGLNLDVEGKPKQVTFDQIKKAKQIIETK